MNTPISFSNGITVNSNAILSNSSLIQGGGTFEINVEISHVSQELFPTNSPACQQLPKVLNIKGVIFLPIFLQLISFKNDSKVESDISNCASKPNLIATLKNTTSTVSININAFNASWSSNFTLTFRVTRLVPADSLIKINGLFTTSVENKMATLIEAKSYAPKALQVAVETTSNSQTPLFQLLDKEVVYMNGTFVVPSVTTSLTLIITLPNFGDNVYMDFMKSLTKITNISDAITTERFSKALSPL